MSTPLSVAVIIPTYNRADLVGEAIDSCLGQTRVPDQIIVVDDGSTDHTQEVLATYGTQITMIRQSNKGLSAARNAGLRAVTADLIALLDSDDTLLPESIALRAHVLETQPEVGVVYSDIMRVDITGKPLMKQSEWDHLPHRSGMILADFARYNVMPVHACLFRRAIIGQVASFDETLGPLADYDFWIRIAARYPFKYLDVPLANYRIHADTMTAMIRPQWSVEERIIRRRLFDLPAFQELKPVDRAAAYRIHATGLALAGELSEARQWYLKSMQCWPFVPALYGLMGLSWLGANTFRGAVRLYRRIRRLPAGP